MFRLFAAMRKWQAGTVDDAGVALASVAVISSVLFMLATMLLGLVAYREMQSSHYVQRSKAMQLADAGTNEYLYQLSQDYNFYKTHPSLPKTTMDEGTWETSASINASGQLEIVSVGTLKNGFKRTLRSTVRFPSFADFVLLVNTTQGVASGATIYGKMHCNGNLSNSGVITGLATATGNCTWGTSASTNYPGGYKNNQKEVKFSDVLADISAMKTEATNAGTYYPASGALGYRVTLNGAQATIQKITAINTIKPRTAAEYAAHPFTPYPDPALGAFTLSPVGTVNIPGDKPLYFDDDVWVSGTYTCSVTIVSGKDIYPYDDLLLGEEDTNYTCGLVAASDTQYPYWSDMMPQDHTVQAAILAQSGTQVPQAAPLSTWGSLQQWYWNTSTTPAKWSLKSLTAAKKNSVTFKGAVGYSQASGLSSGFNYRNFYYDPRLTNNPPPMYPRDKNAAIQIDTWYEGK